MFEEEDDFYEGYEGLFELGLFEETSPACKVLGEFSICPITLASLTTALFETVMRSVPESEQIEFEKKFHESFKIMLEERFEYDVVTKYPDEENED
jgi:hypothetical protein